MDTNTILEMRNIKKNFDDLEVLKDISLSVQRGEVLAIIGPSGSGKSSVVQAGLIPARLEGAVGLPGVNLVLLLVVDQAHNRHVTPCV